MLEDPGLDHVALRNALRTAFGIQAAAFAFVPAYDARAASYEVTTEGDSFFLKVRFDAVREASLDVPVALLEAGVPNILAPLRARSSALWSATDEGYLILYPFVPGRSAVVAGLTDDQWRTFGATLRAVHDSGLARRFAGALPTDSFSSEAGAAAARMLEVARRSHFAPGVATRLAALLEDQSPRIEGMLRRADGLGATLRERPFDLVLCHADIHAANILVSDDAEIHLVDWDGPMIAPRERDLLFVIGSRVTRDVEAHEEAWFFEGYGHVAVNADAIIYYRYERILEDIAEFAASVFFDDSLTEAARQSEMDLVASFFAPGGMLDSVEQVHQQSMAPSKQREGRSSHK